MKPLSCSGVTPKSVITKGIVDTYLCKCPSLPPFRIPWCLRIECISIFFSSSFWPYNL